MKRGIIITTIIVVLAAIGLGGWWYKNRDATDGPLFRTTEVTRGDLVQTITASGTLQAEEVVDVGSQVTGQIASFGTDKAGKPIDYRSEVEQGKVLVTIDTSVYKSEADSMQAALDQAKAKVVSAQADLNQLKAKLSQAERDWQRAEKLGPSDALAESSYDSYKAAYEIAKANVGVGEAEVVSATAGVSAAQASLEKAQRNLGYCVITSPVDGIIIDRRVNIGQTVVSNMSVSSLFLIAKDLKHMQIWASVNEADVGHIHTGQPVTFTVDAYPYRTFKGVVGKLRYNATMTNNVVTYTAEIVVDNSDLALIPYQTTNVSFEVERRNNALFVPNSAFRYTPSPERVKPGVDPADASADTPSSAPATTTAADEPTSRPSRRRSNGEGGRSKAGVVWVVDGQYVKPVKVLRGITDGVNTEITGDELAEGTQIVTSETSPKSEDSSNQTVNPFAPKMPSGSRRGGGR